MRVSIIITIFTFFLLSYLSCQSSKTESGNIDSTNFVEAKIEVKGMTCEGCENTIVKSLKEIDGVEEATASHIDSVALVTFDQSKTTIDKLVESIEKTGYTAGEYKLKDKS